MLRDAVAEGEDAGFRGFVEISAPWGSTRVNMCQAAGSATALALGIGLFFLLPLALTELLHRAWPALGKGFGYNLTDGLIRGLIFPNGVCIGNDQQSIIFSETWGCTVKRYYFDGPNGETIREEAVPKEFNKLVNEKLLELVGQLANLDPELE